MFHDSGVPAPPDVPGRMTAGLCCRVPRAAWQMEAAGRRYSGLTLTLTLVLPCWADRTRFAAFLTSPPRFHDGGVRSATVCAAPFARPGRPAGLPVRSAGAQCPHVQSVCCAGVVSALCGAIFGRSGRTWMRATAGLLPSRNAVHHCGHILSRHHRAGVKLIFQYCP
jgi:hypothetical protein